MASAALGDELSCPICLDLFTEPVSLRCGHNFCYHCIVTALDTQEGSGAFSCPECREEHPGRPLLDKNRKLSSIVENFRSMQEDETKIPCTYCVDSPVAAVKTCLQCEVSMCEKHLMAHNKTVDHDLTEPTSSVGNKKCSIHKKLLEYYCYEDSTCLCVSCCLVGTHIGHHVELLQEAAKEKKEEQKLVLKKLTSKRMSSVNRILSLRDRKKEVQEKADSIKNMVTSLYEDIIRQLEMQKKEVLSEVSSQEKQIVGSLSDQILDLEEHKDEMSRKIGHIEKLYNLTDPISVLQDPEVDPSDQEDDDEQPDPDLDDFLISLVLQGSLQDLIITIKSQLQTKFCIQEMSNLSLNPKTAHELVALSEDLKTASFSEAEQNRPKLPERFRRYPQVMSVETFSCRTRYWEVEVSDSGAWEVGVSYPSIVRKGEESSFGDNNKSWCLHMCDNDYVAVHDSQEEDVVPLSTCRRLGLYLDYEAGHLSFYQLGDKITHLHTFTATFTEPLHAAFYIYKGAWIKITH
ncbi:E3 ubiquitin-protein ligase TRIM39-like [Hyperolius riggenbachi]|uniref:E3 ubiquitin-protein ligase TRIM39-like n=1 Tax=Hyperolius riggenbachi TaxID=752182 RepID=UPI0035A2D981